MADPVGAAIVGILAHRTAVTLSELTVRLGLNQRRLQRAVNDLESRGEVVEAEADGLPAVRLAAKGTGHGEAPVTRGRTEPPQARSTS